MNYSIEARLRNANDSWPTPLYWEPPLIYVENPHVVPPEPDAPQSGRKDRREVTYPPRRSMLAIDEARGILGV